MQAMRQIKIEKNANTEGVEYFVILLDLLPVVKQRPLRIIVIQSLSAENIKNWAGIGNTV
jgi:hypothetical protein